MYVEANAKDYIDHMSLDAPPPAESKPNGLSMPMKSLDISGDGCDQVHFLFLIDACLRAGFHVNVSMLPYNPVVPAMHSRCMVT